MTQARAEANGLTVTYLESGPTGAPETILFLHGGTGTAARHWTGQLAHFGAAGYRCIAPDLRGHGGTTNDRDGLDQSLMADDQAALLDALGIERAHVVGFSVGGVIGLYMSLDHGRRVATLTTIGSHMRVDEHVRASNATIEPTRITIEQPDWAAALRDLHGVHYGPAHWRRLCRWLMETWGRQPQWSAADLARVPVPALIGRGQFDDRAVQSQIDMMVRSIPGARGFVAQGVGHFFHASPGGREALRRELEGFLPPPG